MASLKHAFRPAAVAALLIAATLYGCGSYETRDGPPPVDVRDHRPPPTYPAFSGSVGEYALLSSNQDLHVEGYGIVAELPETGSPDMPDTVREILVNQLNRAAAEGGNTGIPSPEAILNSHRISAVEVRGVIPALTPKGTVFDLTVNAVPGSQTSGLKYGILWNTDLMVMGLGASDSHSDRVADGRGPVYVSPLDTPPAAAPATAPAIGFDAPVANTRKARVIGGGMTITDMPVDLQLYTPSLHIVQSIQQVINFRYQEKPAMGVSANVLSLTIPDRYAHDPRRFVDLCQHLYLGQITEGFATKKAAELIQALAGKTPGTPYAGISVALEGLGTEILNEQLRPNYRSDDPVVRFYTARAGAALNDVQAIVVLQAIAADPASSFRLQAIDELGADARITQNGRAVMALTELLNSDNTEVRKAAYRGLVTLDSPSITHLPSIGRKLDLDIVESSGPNLIYITQSGLPRIALIGHDFILPPNSLYVSRDGQITVDCKDAQAFADWSIQNNLKLNGDNIPPTSSVVLFYRGSARTQSATLTSSAALSNIIWRLAYSPNPLAKNYNPREVFAGVSYQRIVEMLQEMVEKKIINATVYLEPAPPLIASANDLAQDARPEGLIYPPAKSPAPPPAAPGGQPAGPPGTPPGADI